MKVLQAANAALYKYVASSKIVTVGIVNQRLATVLKVP